VCLIHIYNEERETNVKRLCCKTSNIHRFQIIKWLNPGIPDHLLCANIDFSNRAPDLAPSLALLTRSNSVGTVLGMEHGTISNQAMTNVMVGIIS
jgi:hypothetical protein